MFPRTLHRPAPADEAVYAREGEKALRVEKGSVSVVAEGDGEVVDLHARSDGLDFLVVDGADLAAKSETFDNHEGCSEEIGDDSEWVNGLVTTSDSGSGRKFPGSGSFHPTERGHDEYARLVMEQMPKPPSRGGGSGK